MNLNVEFTPYEEAIELKKLGYNIPSVSGYSYPGSYNLLTAAILYQQAFRWFREEHHIYLVIGVAYDKGRTFYIRIETGPTWGYQYFDVEFPTYEEAQLAALKKMIEIVKNK